MVAALEGLGAGCPGDQGGAGASGAEMSALRARPPRFRLQFPRLYNGRKAEAEGSAGEKREERSPHPLFSGLELTPGGGLGRPLVPVLPPHLRRHLGPLPPTGLCSFPTWSSGCPLLGLCYPACIDSQPLHPQKTIHVTSMPLGLRLRVLALGPMMESSWEHSGLGRLCGIRGCLLSPAGSGARCLGWAGKALPYGPGPLPGSGSWRELLAEACPHLLALPLPFRVSLALPGPGVSWATAPPSLSPHCRPDSGLSWLLYSPPQGG